MARMIYASNVSLDGFTEDANGDFGWAPPDDDVFVAITERMASAGTYLYGRRMYELLAVWETDPSLAAHSDLMARYAQVWQAADKIVYSTTLTETSTDRTRLERHFDPDAVRAMKASATTDFLVGGPHLAAQAIAAGLVDEVELYVWPVVFAGRNPALAVDGGAHDLTLIDEQRFASGVLRLHYEVR